MMDVNLSDYIAGGYFLVKPVSRTDWHSAELLPETLISLSGCLCPVFEIFWGMIPGDPEKALQFGIPENLFEAFRQYSDYDEGYPDTFARLETLRKFIARFMPAIHDDIRLIGAGLHKDFSGQLLSEVEESHLNRGIYQTIKLAQPLAAGGVPLGFEILSHTGYGGFEHSWLCNGLEVGMFERFGIHPNPSGCVPSYAEAKQITDWINEAPESRAEPGNYEPWLLVSYPLTIES
jgi:hypothetical protein